METMILFKLSNGNMWNIEDILAEIKAISPLILTSHNYYDTKRKSLSITSHALKIKNGVGTLPDVYNNIMQQYNKEEDQTGRCFAFDIKDEYGYWQGTINERYGLKIIGKHTAKGNWVEKIIKYLNNLGIGEISIDERN